MDRAARDRQDESNKSEQHTTFNCISRTVCGQKERAANERRPLVDVSNELEGELAVDLDVASRIVDAADLGRIVGRAARQINGRVGPAEAGMVQRGSCLGA